MPKIIAISGEIGWDVYPDQIRAQIEEAEKKTLALADTIRYFGL